MKKNQEIVDKNNCHVNGSKIPMLNKLQADKNNNPSVTLQPSNIPTFQPYNPQNHLPKRPYPGNKYAGSAYKKIINHLPPHQIFISGFLGNCAVLREKKPATINIGVEINIDVCNLYWAGYTIPGAAFYVECLDFLILMNDIKKNVFQTYFSRSSTLVYLDPPYTFASRKAAAKIEKSRKIYKNELTDKQHKELLTWAINAKCMVAISHYPDNLYDTMLSHWQKVTYSIATHQGVVKECLYMNYPPPVELHEYTFLGTDKTDRQRIKRKINSFKQKLNNLPPLEKNAIIHALTKQQLKL